MEVVDSKKFAAPNPTKMTLFLRSFLPWQLIRFIIVNLKMTVMIVKSHGQKIPPKK